MMRYATRIKEKRFSWKGRALAASYPAHGSVSLVGSLSGGTQWGEELAGTHAQMLLEGTKTRGKKELQIALDAMGASLSFAADAERLEFSARVRVAHLPALLSLIAETLREPAFGTGELAVLRKRREAQLGFEAHDPNTQAKIGITRLLYPAGHPNRRDTTAACRAALRRLTPAALRAFHRRAVGRESLIISAAGDVAPARFFSLVEKEFKALPSTRLRGRRFAKAGARAPAQAATLIPDKASITYIAGIATGITKNHPAYLPLLLGTQMLGNRSGFTGRLMQTVREKEGLTYGVYSYIPDSSVSTTLDGYIEVWATFAPALFAKGRAAIRREITRLVTEGVGEEEAKNHCELFAARLRVSLSSSGAFARAAHDLSADGHPLSYLDALPRRVLNLSSSEVSHALKTYLRPDRLCECATGPVEKNAFKS